MSSTERQLAIMKDVVLPLDIATRYDLYFTDKRIAIVSMAHLDREQQPGYNPLFGIAPTAPTYENQQRINKVILEEEINNLTLDEKLKLSKKSCFYTYDEIEKVKLISGTKPRFVILSKEYESKFSPNQEQFKQLSDLLPTIEVLRNKLSISISWKALHENPESNSLLCKYCGFKNDSNANFCQSCGKRIREKTSEVYPVTERVCGSCGVKNKIQASFCKNCGVPFC